MKLPEYVTVEEVRRVCKELNGCTNNIVYRFLMLRILITSYTKLGLFCI